MSQRERAAGIRVAALAAGLFVVTLAVFALAADHDFVNYDDDRYVTANEVVQRGLDAGSVRWAFTTTHASNWHPLTWLSHLLDVELFGLDAGAHHLVSAALHALAAALLLAALAALTRAPWASALAAAVFALHPLRVESVSWVAERKDVLAGLFAAATLLAWAGWVRRPGAGRYLVVLVLFALGLASKPTLVTLPFALLLLDLWPLRRTATTSAGRLVLEKLPLLALAAGSCTITLVAQTGSGATELLRDLSPGLAVANAFASVWTYVAQTVWPAGLACFYPHAAIVADDPAAALRVPALLGAVLVAGLVALGWRVRRAHGYVLAGWLWFLGMLVPMLGLVQVGTQAHADRYTYLPHVGLAIVLAFAAAELARARPALRGGVVLLGVAVLAGLSLVTARQIATWRDAETLWRHALAVTGDNYVAHNNLGRLMADRGELEQAGEHFTRALAIRPGTPPDPEAARVAANLAGTLVVRGRVEEALAPLRRAVELDPDAIEARGQLGWLLMQRGDDAQAVRHLNRVIRQAPEHLEATTTLAWVLATSRDPEVRDGERALALAQRVQRTGGLASLNLLETLAAAHAERGAWGKALEWQEEALAAARAEALPREQLQGVRNRLAAYRTRRPWRKTP